VNGHTVSATQTTGWIGGATGDIAYQNSFLVSGWGDIRAAVNLAGRKVSPRCKYGTTLRGFWYMDGEGPSRMHKDCSCCFGWRIF
jgi:hypothetical protein